MFGSMDNGLKTELTSVSEKFKNQVSQLVALDADVERNQNLQDRLIKASIYFEEKTRVVLFHPLQQADLDIDNKAVRKSVSEAVNRLREEIKVKLACFHACREGFRVKDYLSARAKASMDMPEISGIHPKKNEPALPGQVLHPRLYNSLKSWRQARAGEENVSAHAILPQKAMMDLVSLLPANAKELGNIKGFGRKKLKQFGGDILRIIREFKKENHMEVPEAEDLPEEPKKSSMEQSYELFRAGKTVSEIATARNMALSTIQGHLAHYIGTGELEIFQLVPEEKVHRIADYFRNNDTSLLAPAKAALGEEVDWGELRMVLKYLERMNGKC
jgi:Sec-independent protein translocase protein TatA